MLRNVSLQFLQFLYFRAKIAITLINEAPCVTLSYQFKH